MMNRNDKKSSFIIFAVIILLISQSCVSRSKFKKDGIITTATVIDGNSKKGKEYTSYNLNLSFVTKNGRKMTVHKSVSGKEYSKVYLNCEIPIIYLPEDPTKLDVILTDDEVGYYLGIANRSLYLQDLYSIYDKTNLDSITNYLNVISYKWTDSITDKATHYWENASRKELVALDSGVLTYVTYNHLGQVKLLKEMESDGYIKTKKDSTGTEIYQNQNYKIALSKKIDKEEKGFSFTMYYVINMVKIN